MIDTTTGRQHTLALFIDFENLALGVRDEGAKLDMRLVMNRLVEKGRVIVRRAYCDWTRWSEYKNKLHELAVDLIKRLESLANINAGRGGRRMSEAQARQNPFTIDQCFGTPQRHHPNFGLAITGWFIDAGAGRKIRAQVWRILGHNSHVARNGAGGKGVGTCDPHFIVGTYLCVHKIWPRIQI